MVVRLDHPEDGLHASQMIQQLRRSVRLQLRGQNEIDPRIAQCTKNFLVQRADSRVPRFNDRMIGLREFSFLSKLRVSLQTGGDLRLSSFRESRLIRFKQSLFLCGEMVAGITRELMELMRRKMLGIRSTIVTRIQRIVAIRCE